jgi:hypothetical protein
MAKRSIDRDRIALAVQQPWAELLLRGVKTLEIRSTAARIRGPIYLYASRRLSSLPDAAEAAARWGLSLSSLPQGVVVGAATLVEIRLARADDAAAACLSTRALTGKFAWRFADPEPFDLPLPARCLPYGIWFYPFRRQGVGGR